MDALNTSVASYQYNANGWLTNRSTPAKGWSLYGYDHVGNLLSITYQFPHLTFQYDKLNRPTNMVDAVGSTSYAYDGVGQVLSEDGPWPSDTVTYTDLDQLRLGLSVQSPSGTAWSQTYGYDGDPPPGVRHFAGRRLQLRLRPGLPPPGARAHVAQLQLRHQHLRRRGAAAEHHAPDPAIRRPGFAPVQYNAAGQRTRQTRLHGDYPSYTYDNRGQFKTALALESGGATRG